MVANGDKITQQAEGRVPFNVPDTAASVAVFDHMPNALLAAGPLVKAGCYIILDTLQATVINKKTGNIVLTADFDTQSATWDAYPTLARSPTIQRTPQFASNAYRIQTKKELIKFYHKAAGNPVKTHGSLRSNAEPMPHGPASLPN